VAKTRTDPGKPGPGPAEEPAPRDDVRVVGGSKHRCPFCHEGVDAEDPRGVVCGGCLARHHDECWVERQACSACAGTRRLVVDPLKPPATDEQLFELIEGGARPSALTALRGRGLDERQATQVADLLAQALRGPPLPRALHLSLTLQAVLLFAGAVSAFFAVGGTVILGLVAALVGTFGLVLSSSWTTRASTKRRLALCAALPLLVVLLGAALIDLGQVGPGTPWPVFGLLAGALSVASLVAASVARGRSAGAPPVEPPAARTDSKS
jgi:hypothetical protein